MPTLPGGIWRDRTAANRVVTIPAAPAMAVIGIQPGKALLMEFLVTPQNELLVQQLLAGAERGGTRRRGGGP